MKLQGLSNDQKTWLLIRNIKEGGSYPFPSGAFRFFNNPNFHDSEYVDNYPLGKNFDHQRFKVKEIKNGFCRGNFAFRTRGKNIPDLWILKDDLELRGLLESLALLIICFIPFVIKNNLPNQ